MSDQTIDPVLGAVFLGAERLAREEIYRRALALPASAEVMTRLDMLPEGEYSEDEAGEAVELLWANASEAGAIPDDLGQDHPVSG